MATYNAVELSENAEKQQKMEVLLGWGNIL
jgi:hypothetical protein